MASHYKWYPSSEEVIVPFNARYSFPSQANKAVKITPRIPPKNGAVFTPGQIIRVEFPAQGYVNPLNTTLEFDVCLQTWGTSAGDITRFQNNIQSIFNRVRLLYGATPLEDMINYNMIVRNLTEWTSTDQTGTMDQTSVAEGIGGVVFANDSATNRGLVNTRQNYIQGIDNSGSVAGFVTTAVLSAAAVVTPGTLYTETIGGTLYTFAVQSSSGTALILTGPITAAAGAITNTNGSVGGPATLTVSSVNATPVTLAPGLITSTVPLSIPATITLGSVYSQGGNLFTVTKAITAGSSLMLTGPGSIISGTLTFVSSPFGPTTPTNGGPASILNLTVPAAPAISSIPAVSGSGTGAVPNQYGMTGVNVSALTAGTYCTRRYQVNFALGLFTQDKLIPTKWMASQLAIEITLEQPQACIISFEGASQTSVPTPTYTVGNINLIPEILEFDASYDAMFLKGLREGGVPLKFSSWHTFIFSTSASSALNLLVQERSRSVKALFAVQRRGTPSYNIDSHATLFDSSTYNAMSGNTLQNYQWRIGGRYFPAQPVQCSTVLGNGVSNGGAEAYVELQKALNIVGDYRLKTGVNTIRWAVPPFVAAVPNSASGTIQTTSWPELDYSAQLLGFNPNGNPMVAMMETAGSVNGNAFCSNMGSCCFAMSTDLETSNGVEISGLNAEEQSDIALIVNYYGPQAAANIVEVYSYYDAMIILRENNVLELIQ